MPAPRLLVFPHLAEVAGLAHALTTRVGGVSEGGYATLNLGRSSGDRGEAVAENRRRVATALGFERVHVLHQVHGARVVRVEDASPAPAHADVWLVTRPDRLVAVLGADCPLVLVVDPRARAFALAHSGWRGTVAGAVPAALDALRSLAASRAEDLRVGIAPGMCAGCYEIGAEVVDAVVRHVPGGEDHVRAGRPGHAFLDLHGAIRAQLAACGVPDDNVQTIDGCTFEDATRFFSHRRDGPATGRHALLAGLTG